jgi:EamA domain-containing membrane protein RarD
VNVKKIEFNALDADLVVKMFSALFFSIAIVIGIVTVFSNDTRWSSSAYQTASLFPGAPKSVGLIILTFGLMCIYGIAHAKKLIAVLGYLFSALWCFFFALSFLREALNQKSVSPLGFIVFGGLGAGFLLLSIVFYLSNVVDEDEKA